MFKEGALIFYLPFFMGQFTGATNFAGFVHSALLSLNIIVTPIGLSDYIGPSMQLVVGVLPASV